MNRKSFLMSGLVAAVIAGFPDAEQGLAKTLTDHAIAIEKSPLAIAMWDFSWLERRWMGGGYEDWDKVLDELTDRGYNALRIDAYPHLIARPDTDIWTLLPVWDQNDWGSPGMINVEVRDSLVDFMHKCKNRKIKVALSTWYRQDLDNVRMQIVSPKIMAENWLKTLDLIKREGLLDTVLYVDLNNEWPAKFWTPFYQESRQGHDWTLPSSVKWMGQAIGLIAQYYPEIPLTFSFDHYQEKILQAHSLPFLDFIEQHLWMSNLNDGEFNKSIGFDWNGFSPEDFKRTVKMGKLLYQRKPEYWDDLLKSAIVQLASDARAAGKPLISTECWSLVNYKDYPMLEWDYIKHLCKLGTITAAGTGQWLAMATSNFCGPQFRGMWNDVAWHRTLTGSIRSSAIDVNLLNGKLYDRL